MNLTDQINTALIAEGYDPECVEWVCEKHHRHCTHLGTEHTIHECFWCVIERGGWPK